MGTTFCVISEVGAVPLLSYSSASSLRARASSSLSCASTDDTVTARETGLWLRGCTSRCFAEEDEGTVSLDGPGRNLGRTGRRAESRSDCSNTLASSSSWERSELACSLSVCTDNCRASSSSSSSFIPCELSTDEFGEGKVSRAASLVFGGPFAMRLGLALSETFGCGKGLRVTVSEEERAPRGFAGNIGGGGSGGTGGTSRGGDAPRCIGEGGWDLDPGNNGGRRVGGMGMNGEGLGGNVGEVVGDIISGVFGGRGGTTDCKTDCGSSDCGNGSGGGGGWNRWKSG